MTTLMARPSAGFTLIELLVVIGIIGLLASIVLAALVSARDKARYALAQSNIAQFTQMSVMAQGATGKTLEMITGNECSDCVCRTGLSYINVSTSDQCYVNWAHALSAIQSASENFITDTSSMLRDPWGSPYALDENEREFGPTDCTPDTIRTMGPDGIDRDDDWFFLIPLSRACP